MPNSISKNKKDKSTIVKMLSKAFPGKEVQTIEELTEGFFNVAYCITMEDESEYILKIAPSPDIPVMTHEINIMYSEVYSMKQVSLSTDVPVAKVVAYDNSHTICNSDYFIMEKLRGKSFAQSRDTLSEDQKYHINYQIGKYTASINTIKYNKFGYYGQPEKQGENWYEVFKSMIQDTYDDALRKDIYIQVPMQKLLLMLEKDRDVFEQVKEPCLVHWDIWAGNVFIDGDKITGLIDFERCLWADELMEVGFRTYSNNNGFYDGYGIEKLNKEQLIRAQWYDIYLFLISCLECDYRSYDNKGIYDWGTEKLLDIVMRKENS